MRVNLNTALAGCAGVLALGFAAGVFVLVFFMTRPRGEAVGQTNLMNTNATLAVTGNTGESLFFRTDVSLSIPTVSFTDDEQRERALDKLLRQSTLTVRAKSPSGTEKVASCSVYNGRASSTSTTPGVFSRSGMLNDCEIPLDASGSWTVQSSVAWAEGLVLLGATLEVRRESAAK